MAKGHKGESCAEAVKACVAQGEVVSFSEMCARLQSCGNWKEETIWQHLMALVVNLPPARRHWPGKQPFLFLRPDGQYERYNPEKHPPIVD